MRDYRNRSLSGFTLIELVIAITVMALLIGIAVPAFNGIQASAKTNKILAAYESMKLAVEQHYADTGKLAIEYSGSNRTASRYHLLSMEQTNTKGWKGPYLDHAVSTTDNPYKSYCYIYNSFRGGAAKPYGLQFKLMGASSPALKDAGQFVAFHNVPEAAAIDIDEALDRDVSGNWMQLGRVQWKQSGGWLMIYLMDI